MFRVIGPVGTKELMSNLERGYAADIKIRIADEARPPESVAIAAARLASRYEIMTDKMRFSPGTAGGAQYTSV